MELSPHQEKPQLPTAPVENLIAPLARFMHIEASSGLVLMAATLAALIWANSTWAEHYVAWLETTCAIQIGNWGIQKDLLHVINDGLMTIFFFVVGLEIKREMVTGELREFRQALLPIVAAVGGMLVPAAVYAGIAWTQEFPVDAQRGWAIPMATDIAFVVGALALFGKRAPFGLKILLLSLAIVDDLGAVLVIAFVFTEQIAWSYLGVAGGAFVATLLLRGLGVRSIPAYVIVGAVAWYAVLKSGVHPTIAGVALGLMTPTSAWITRPTLLAVLEDLALDIKEGISTERAERRILYQTNFATREAISPLERLESGLHPWVAFLIMPLFALANAGVAVQISAITEPVALAVAAGLALGKPLGILLFCWIATIIGVTRLPSGVSWHILAGGACFGGIGFTMSLFLTQLALPVEYQSAGKVGTLMGSVLSAALGSALLLTAKPDIEPKMDADEIMDPERGP